MDDAALAAHYASLRDESDDEDMEGVGSSFTAPSISTIPQVSPVKGVSKFEVKDELAGGDGDEDDEEDDEGDAVDVDVGQLATAPVQGSDSGQMVKGMSFQTILPHPLLSTFIRANTNYTQWAGN